MGQLQTRPAQKIVIQSPRWAAEQHRRDIDAEGLKLREHGNATGLQPGGLQWVVISRLAERLAYVRFKQLVSPGDQMLRNR